MVDWIQRSWPLLLPWLLFVFALAAALRNAFAAEKDRRALKRADMEQAKLRLEIARLRNDPELVADRRAIYGKLRGVLAEIVREAKVMQEQVSDLHEIRHDSIFRFPEEVPEEIRGLIHAAVRVHIDEKKMQNPGDHTAQEWKELVDRESSAFQGLVSYHSAKPERYKPLLSL